MPNGKEDAAQAIHRGQEHNGLTEVEAEEGQRLGQQASPEGASVAPGEGIPHGLQQMQLEYTDSAPEIVSVKQRIAILKKQLGEQKELKANRKP